MAAMLLLTRQWEFRLSCNSKKFHKKLTTYSERQVRGPRTLKRKLEALEPCRFRCFQQKDRWSCKRDDQVFPLLETAAPPAGSP